MKKIRVAILGAGAIAAAHMDAYLHFPEFCAVTAVCDLFVGKAEKMIAERKLDAKAFASLDELLDQCEVDAVSICLPPDMHCKAAVTALHAGKDVLCEKPMATSLDECDQMIAAAEKNSRILSPICQNRFKTPVQKVYRLLESGVCGKVNLVSVNSLWWRGADYYDLWWRGTWENEGGGCLISHAVHHVDLLQWMVGMPLRVTAVISNAAHENSECEDAAIGILEYPGFLAQITASVVTHGEEQELIFQTDKARLSVPWDPRCETALPNGFPETDAQMLSALTKQYQELPLCEPEGHPAQIGNFLRASLGLEPIAVTAQEGRNTIELITAMYASACTRSTVSLPLDPGNAFYTKQGIIANMPRFHEKTRSVDNFAPSRITLGRDVGK